MLVELMRRALTSTCVLQVITDPITARSKGYGFVRFGSESERDRALSEMAGHIISNRPVRVSIATAKKSPALAAAGVSPAGVSGQVLLGDMDPTNTTLFIGGLNAAVRGRMRHCSARACS